MATDLRKLKKAERLKAKERRKDRLIQTRVDRRLQKVLQEESRRKRMSVSNLVRNILEDAFGLADPDVGPMVDDSMKGAVPPVAPDLEHIYAWNPVVLGKPVECVHCRQTIPAGDQGFIGMSDDPTKPRAWICESCSEEI